MVNLREEKVYAVTGNDRSVSTTIIVPAVSTQRTAMLNDRPLSMFCVVIVILLIILCYLFFILQVNM